MLKQINVTRLSLILIFCYVGSLAFSFGRENGWLIEADGHKREAEFIGVYAAGQLTNAGKPAAALDWNEHRRAHDALIGRQKTENYYPWGYPPPYLALAGLLAWLPYLVSALVMIGGTLALYVWAAMRIGGSPRAAAWALASPATLVNASVAHTGFLVAGLFGLGLAALPAAPLTAGVAFGLLAFKPQFCLLLPVALVAGGHWRACLVAGLTISAMALASLAAYGAEPWLNFLPQVARITEVIRDGRLDLSKLVSPYGLIRSLGAVHGTALAIQAAIAVGLAAAVFKLWRADAPFDLKAAGLTVASMLATPYLFPYDLTVLSVAVLFLARSANYGDADEFEVGALLAGALLLLVCSLATFQLGLISIVIAGGVVVRRWRAETARSLSRLTPHAA